MSRAKRNEQLFKCFAAKRNFPNLLLHGDPLDSRKLTAALLRTIYRGEESYQQNVVRYFFMGNDNIKTVRNKLYEKVMFKVRSKTINDPGFKTIIIEQAGKISHSIQNILWDLLEKNLKSTRFILITSRLYGVIPLIRERCYDVFMGTIPYTPISQISCESLLQLEPTPLNAQKLYDNGISPDALINAIIDTKSHSKTLPIEWLQSESILVALAEIDGRLENLDDRIALLAILKILECGRKQQSG